MKERKLSRRDFLLLSGGAAAGTVLAACQPQVIEKTVEVPVEVTKIVTEMEEVEVPVEVEVTAVPPPQEPVTIRFISTAPEYYYNVDAFSEQHPLIDVEFEDIGDEAFEAAVLTRVAGGDPPELAWASGVRLWRFAQAGAVMDIASLAEASPHAELDQIAPEAIAAYTSPDYFPPGQVFMAPGLYGWPVYLTVMHMVYNKRILDDAGVDYPVKGWTWDDFGATVRAVNEPGSAWGFVMPSSATGAVTTFVHNMLWTNGADVYDADGKCALASPAAVETLQFLQDLVLDGTVLLGAAAEGADFLGGNLAFQYSGNFVIGWYDQTETFEDPYSIVPVPVKNTDAIWGGVDGFAFLKGSANPWAGWELAKWESSYAYEGGPGGQKVLNDEDQAEVISVNAEAAAESYVNPNYGVPEEAVDWFPEWALANARADPWLPSAPGFNYWTAYDGLWEGDSVEDTLAQVAAQIDSANEGMPKFG
jgi:multiple sugar transport system substrate-binding protein